MGKVNFKTVSMLAVCGMALLTPLAAGTANAADLPLKAGHQVAPQWRIVTGYDLLYWTDVQRAGGLIDTTINPNLIPPVMPGGPQRPMPVFNTSALLAQGFNVGVRYDC
jgi:quinol-cytochrome oxidoreductase complex cytochrome b subunit